MKIGSVEVGPEQPVCIVAELSCNHGQDIAKAKELIDAAKWAGADLVKMQIYTADEMCLPGVKCPVPGPWDGQDLYELYKRAGTPWEWWPILRDYAASKGVILFSSAFSREGVEYLVREGCPAIKIASHEANWVSLVTVATPPLIVSACTRRDASSAAHWAGVILWCPAGYPAGTLSAADLGWLHGLMDFYDYAPSAWGLSDNAGNVSSAMLAAQEGASMIEAHLMLHDVATPDARFSMLPTAFAAYVRFIRDQSRRQPSPPSPYRRSVWLTKPVKRGESVMEHVRMLRPFGHIEPRSWPQFGKATNRRPWNGWLAARDLEPGPLRWEDVE